MRRHILITMGVLIIGAGAVLAADAAGVPAESEIKTQTHCPVMGNPIDPDIFTDYEGQRIFFCCPPCIQRFGTDPAGFIKQLEDQGVTLTKTPRPQTSCPVMGGAIDKSVFVDHEGERIYFCCADCVKTFGADPLPYLKKLHDAGITLETVAPPKGKEKDHTAGGHRDHD